VFGDDRVDHPISGSGRLTVMDTPIDARAAGAARATRRARRRDAHALHDGLGLNGGLAGALDHVDGLDVAALLELVELLDVEADRLAVLRRAVMSRLRSLCTTALRTPTPLLRPQEAARILNVSVDWLRDHGKELGLVVQVGDLLRYDPVAVEALRHRRARRPLPRD
jgi:hypothetical protein